MKIRGKQFVLGKWEVPLLASPVGYDAGHVWLPRSLLGGGPALPRSPALLCSSPLCLVFQEVLPATGGAVGPEDMQSVGSTINLRDLQ